MGKKDPQSGGVYVDCWHLPGGGIDTGETPIEALQREMREETSLDITSATVRIIDDTTTGNSEKRLKDTGEVVQCEMKFYVYRIILNTTAAATHCIAGDDLQILQWFDIDDALNHKLTPPSEAFFREKMHLVTD